MTTFVSVVRKNSFTVAARSLGISRALVSRHIADLELHLSVRLLNRTTRSITLTEAGRRYFDFCSQTLESILSEEKAITDHNEEPEGRLSVIAPKWIGNLDIAEAVTSFSLQFPRINVELTLGGMSPKTYDFIDRGYDVALQTKRIPDSLVKVKKVATIHYILAAAPAFLKQHGTPKTPKDLASFPCVIQINDPVWRFVDKNGKPTHVKVTSTFASNAYLVLRRAAIKGIGIALLPRQVVADDLKTGDLVELLPAIEIPERPLYVAFAPGKAPPQKVRSFANFLVDWFREHPIQ